MIARIHGRLVSLQQGRALLECGPLAYEVLVPSADEQRLGTMIDETVCFHTLHYHEAQGQGASFTPRLVGFLEVVDRDFFELFTTVKGVGNRKALRALALPFAEVARAIAEKDVVVLKSLPEIGKRTAETIVAELNGKVDRFIEFKPAGAGVPAAGSDLSRDVVEVLVQLGESRSDALALVERVLAVDPEIDDPGQLLEAAFRIKG